MNPVLAVTKARERNAERTTFETLQKLNERRGNRLLFGQSFLTFLGQNHAARVKPGRFGREHQPEALSPGCHIGFSHGLRQQQQGRRNVDGPISRDQCANGLEPFERHFRRMVRAERNDRTLNQRPAERHEH